MNQVATASSAPLHVILIFIVVKAIVQASSATPDQQHPGGQDSYHLDGCIVLTLTVCNLTPEARLAHVI